MSAMKYRDRLPILILLLCTLSLAMNAQEGKSRKEHIEKFRSMKIAFFTENLALTPEEAEKFWPAYNEYEQKKREIYRHSHLRPRNIEEQLANMTDQQAEEMVDKMMEAREQEVQLAAAFHEDLKKILPPKKVVKFYITEIQFREYMLRKIRDEHHGDKRKKDENPPSGSLLP
jgi:Spy/CpxP family protein refolding chaperone